MDTRPNDQRLRIVTLSAVFAYCLSSLAYSLGGSTVAWAAERHMMMPRVPADQLEAARALQSPLPESDDIVKKGKTLYEGKALCANCHGPQGRGDGPGAAALDPSPRNFHHHGFWRHRTEGEIFWVIKNGSPGTGMPPFGAMLSDEEIWSLIQYERSFSGGPGHDMGPGRGRGPRGHRGGDMRHMGPGEGRGPGSPRGGEECCEGR